MNKQRKVLITITYNEMGIIIDTKAEEVAQPDLQQTCNKLATDCISRQDAIDALGDEPEVWTDNDEYAQGLNNQWHYDRNAILRCPSAQPEAKEIGYAECANAMLKMWMDNVLTDGEYNRIMDKLNEYWGKVNA